MYSSMYSDMVSSYAVHFTDRDHIGRIFYFVFHRRNLEVHCTGRSSCGPIARAWLLNSYLNLHVRWAELWKR